MSLNKEEMDEVTGWLFDVYDHSERGIVLWIITDSGKRLCLRMDFPITFYAAGDFKLLRAAWVFLKGKAQLVRAKRRDLFLGERDVMQVTLTDNGELIHELQDQFPALDYYDADIPITLRFIARTGVHLLGRCRITLNGELIQTIQPLDSPWQISPEPIPLRVMEIIPNVNPAIRPPGRLRVRHERGEYSMSMDPLRPFLIGLQADLIRFDPDLIFTNHGDDWLFPKLTEWCKETGLHVDINRDKEREIQTKKAGSYFAYGQTIHRGAQSHLFGRWHIDRRNAMLFSEYGLDGVLEQTRVTGIGVQEMARKSPGAGITAMQMTTALRTGVMIPLHKQQAEGIKTLAGLIRADKGGLIYQPIIGVHRDVAQIDFASMYPSIMVHHNISPETIGQKNAKQGLIPQTLQPLLEKRLKLKELISGMDERDCRVKSMKQRAAALKWLLVVCFGYLGYKNARFGKIESHEMVTAISRELMLQAKEVAEDMGFTVLHMYVDSLFVQKEGLKEKGDFEPLLHAITEQTHISIMLEGIYRWVCFPPSKRDARISVPNRYFGVLNNGEIKYRGIEARRRDTPFWVKKIQLEVLNCLAKARSPEELPEYLPEINDILTQAKRDLRNGHVPLDELVVIQSLSRAVEGYTSPSPAARAAMQLQAAGKEVAPGQFMRFVFVRGDERVRAWELGVDARTVDVKRYCALLDRAVKTVLEWAERKNTNSILSPEYCVTGTRSPDKIMTHCKGYCPCLVARHPFGLY
jgi:DNA polymerase-2